MMLGDYYKAILAGGGTFFLLGMLVGMWLREKLK